MGQQIKIQSFTVTQHTATCYQYFDEQYLDIFCLDSSDCWVALDTLIKGNVCVLNGKKCYLNISHKYR